MSEYSYLGLKDSCTGEYKQLGSKFIAQITPIATEEEAKDFIKEQKRKFAAASHVCSAYILGTKSETQYFSDDGEPSNSAGRPILNSLLSAGLSYVVATVVRYYGGKKLGVGGLIQAYGQAVENALEHASPVQMELRDQLLISMDPAETYKFYNIINPLPGVQSEAIDDKFMLSCTKSMTPYLRDELLKIPTLVLKIL